MELLLQTAVEGKRDAKGLAIIIHNSYTNVPVKPLPGTDKDGEAMIETFKFLQFTTIDLKDAAKEHVSSIVKAMASYSHYPMGYKYFAIYFAGHGDKDSILLGGDGNKFNYKTVILKDLNKRFNPEVVDRVSKAKILVFIDACRGTIDPIRGRPIEDNVPENMMIAYSTKEEFQAKEHGVKGGIWSQKLAVALRQKDKAVRDILQAVRDDMPSDYKEEALPETWNARAGEIVLNEDMDWSQEKTAAEARAGGGGGGGGDGGGKDADKGNQGSADGHPPIKLDTLSHYNILKKAQDHCDELAVNLGQEDDLPGYRAGAMGNTYTICMKIFKAWIDNDGHPPHYPLTWQGVYDIMKSIGKKKIAKDMLNHMSIQFND